MGERALQGVGAAPGVAIGEAVVLDGLAWTSRGEALDRATRPVQLDLARRSLTTAATELQTIADRLRGEGRLAEADIVEAGVLIAGDPGLTARVEVLIVEQGHTAADALREASEASAADLAAVSDRMLAERADDVRSVGRRAAARADGRSAAAMGGVIVSSTLGPADVAETGLGACGIALSGGGVTAHAAIVARSLGLPMVVGLGDRAFEAVSGEIVVVDGDEGLLVLNPSPERVAAARLASERSRRARETARDRRDEPAVTRDGRRVRVLANASTTAEVLEGMAQGAEGVGLLRSELPYLDAAGWPSAEQQMSYMRVVLAPLAGHTATVRLFDFGGDKTPPFLTGTDRRGIDLLLDAPDALRGQLAAILDAGVSTNLRILIPMVTSTSQVEAVRRALAEVLGARREPQLGAMIETPEAALNAEALASAVDFFSIGTNDLTQLALGLDRESSRTAPVLHPRVLGLIARTVGAARRAGIVTDVCGEAASDAAAMPILVGLGVDELSVAAARVGEVRESVRGLEMAACRLAAERLLDQAADAVG